MDQDPFGSPPAGTLFDEAWYLSQNPGIAEAVQRGQFRSGWDHYVQCGQAEGRDGAPRQRAPASGSMSDPSKDDPMPDKMAMTRLAYQLILGREELDENIIRSQSHFPDVYELRRRMLNGPEHAQNTRLLEFAKLMYTDEAAIAQLTAAFDEFIAQDAQTEQLIARLTDEAGLTNAYAYFHTKRFRDQIRASAALRNKRLGHLPVVRFLDVGQAPVTRMYAQVIQGIDLYTANLAMGTSAEYEMAKYDSLAHYFVDFDSELISERYPELISRPFDIIVFCEVIEHIRASPEEQIRDLLNILAPGGVLIVSTPNALSYNRIQKLSAGQKWDSIYSRKNRHLHDEHHIHVREFTVTEMLEAARNAGGEVVMFGTSDYYSNLAGNMVRRNYVSSREVQTLIITHPGGASATP